MHSWGRDIAVHVAQKEDGHDAETPGGKEAEEKVKDLVMFLAGKRPAWEMTRPIKGRIDDFGRRRCRRYGWDPQHIVSGGVLKDFREPAGLVHGRIRKAERRSSTIEHEITVLEL